MRLPTYNDWLKGQRPWQDIAIEEVVASVARGEPLRKMGVRTAGQAAERADAELLAVPGIGKTTVEAIRRRIAALQEHERRMVSMKRATMSTVDFDASQGKKPPRIRH